MLVSLIFIVLLSSPVIFAIWIGNKWSKIEDEVWQQYIDEGILDKEQYYNETYNK
jgi:hypothetical protein